MGMYEDSGMMTVDLSLASGLSTYLLCYFDGFGPWDRAGP